MNTDTILNRSTDILHAPVGTEKTVMMSVAAGMYYGVDAVGSRVWELLETPQSVGQICRQLCTEFEVDEATCRDQVLAFVGELVAEGVVHADPA